MKICALCRKEKAFDRFYRDSASKDGRKARCKTCHKAYEQSAAGRAAKVRYYSKADRKSHVAAYRSSQKGKEVLVRAMDKYYTANPDRLKAKNAVNNAVRLGRIIKPKECSACCEAGVIEGHHWSYKKENWLSVIWLCTACHKNLHANLRASQRVKNTTQGVIL